MGKVTTRKRKEVSAANALVEATASLLMERTSLDVSLSEIAKRSGFNSALIKYYFGNKEGLLLALLERDATLAMDALNRLIEMDVSAEQKLRIHINGIISTYYRSPYLNRLIHYMIEVPNEAASSRVEAIYIHPMLEAYRAIIEQGIQEKSFRRVEPAFLYHSLVGACEHLFYAAYYVRSALGQSGITEEIKQRYIVHVTDMCLLGLVDR